LETIKVNHPLRIGSTAVYLTGNGYAPALTVRDATGAVAFAGPVPFLPRDSVYTSRGVVKVPDVSPGQKQLGILGFLLPTALVDEDGPRSVFPQPIDPVLVLTVYAGDLGLDDGVPQNVYELDTSAMEPAVDEDGRIVTLVVRPGESADLPGGLGSVTFDGLPRFVALDVRDDPAEGAVLVFALLALTGLGLSLFVPRRRLWLRLTDAGDGRTVIDAAALARGDDPGLRADLDRTLAAAREASQRGPEPSRPPPVEDQ
jgi:cytochrome c biogenesis protein